MDETMVLLLTFSVLLICCLRFGLASRHYISQFPFPTSRLCRFAMLPSPVGRWRWLWRECICLFYESISLSLSCTRMWGGLDSRAITVINLDFCAGAGEGGGRGCGGERWNLMVWFDFLVCFDDLSEFSWMLHLLVLQLSCCRGRVHSLSPKWVAYSIRRSLPWGSLSHSFDVQGINMFDSW
jgi:hypothetical protein